MKHFGNALNLLSAAVITATTPVASTAIYRTSMSKAGGGLVRATGAFTGQTDATFDVEVLNDTIVGTPRVSTPAFSGVGNAAMTLQSATGGVAAQSITITLADLGTETRNAYSPFQGATLRAKTSGADANYIELTIDESALVRTATTYSLLAEIVAGTNEYVGSAWDFGGAPRNPDGTIPSNTVRISFGDDPQVYRQFKVFQNGAYVYSFTPAPVRNIPVGTAVKTVTGGRTVSVVHTPGAAAATFIISTVYTLGQLVKPIAPNGHWYEVTVAGTSAAASPTWPTNGATVCRTP